jgi:hypothetical protein
MKGNHQHLSRVRANRRLDGLSAEYVHKILSGGLPGPYRNVFNASRSLVPLDSLAPTALELPFATRPLIGTEIRANGDQ